MLRSAGILIYMLGHYIVNTRTRIKYAISDQKLDATTKRKNREILYKAVRRLSFGMFKVCGTEIEVRGKENMPNEGPVVYMGTHKSLFDAPLMAYLVDEPIIFIGKKEAKKLPIIQGWFEAMGCIYIDREDMKQSLQSILEGIKELKEGQSIVIFPEGTRSRGEEMIAFKPGSFKLATKANVPIVPIAMQRTYKILEEKGRIQKTKVYVNIGKTIDVPNMSVEEKKLLPKEVESYVKKLLEEITFDT